MRFLIRVRLSRTQVHSAPALSEAKVALYRQMRALGVGKAELRAPQLHCPRSTAVGPAPRSRLDQLEQAFLRLGKR